ncbi:F-box/kelch-repeat protein At3g06240-like [Rutidosis leptorrhynchoides]|uniref:F-box/kelch-repeat protein At3g06240-like n=1 Tax=Rutidosis leptorrhynchoides TaxID=125765 RepID=UPI003A9A598D
MVVTFLPDEIIINILARLPAKPLVRFRCVSKYWHCMLMEPYFMNLRSRKAIILAINKGYLDFIDVDNNNYTTFKRRYPLEYSTGARVIGSFNGLVLMVILNEYFTLNAFVLYNPFTGEFKKLLDPPTQIISCKSGFGFGYGGTNPTEDLKIVKFTSCRDICEVYDFKTNSWSSQSSKKYDINCITFAYPVGTFSNGNLYWIRSEHVLLAFGVKDMVLSEIVLPRGSNFIGDIGTINGCLCALKMTTSSKFELWVMNDVDSTWANTHSFTLDLKWDIFYHTLNIFDDGKILMVNPFSQLIIYDVLKSSYETLNISFPEHFHRFFKKNCVQFVETLVSPLDVCFSRWGGREKKSNKIK